MQVVRGQASLQERRNAVIRSEFPINWTYNTRNIGKVRKGMDPRAFDDEGKPLLPAKKRGARHKEIEHDIGKDVKAKGKNERAERQESPKDCRTPPLQKCKEREPQGQDSHIQRRRERAGIAGEDELEHVERRKAARRVFDVSPCPFGHAGA